MEQGIRANPSLARIILISIPMRMKLPKMIFVDPDQQNASFFASSITTQSGN